uniref:Zinc finger, CCHC-type n=1 Tax=Tanacetum cinerariifolium TaxID=118510 RepID=A0A6L2N9Z4_TANCI|nr:zinc finger, CCHC-type [Tanacetum cinerariifolium]
MAGAKMDIEIFDETGDFRLWRVKMSALLIRHGCEAAVKILPTNMEAEAKAELNKKAHSAVILCLRNKILREVTWETTAAGFGLNFLLYGREALTLDDVMSTLNLQDIKEMSKGKGNDVWIAQTSWEEATCTTPYLINRSPSTTIEKKTPMEMWSGHLSDYEILRVFICVAYSHVKRVSSSQERLSVGSRYRVREKNETFRFQCESNMAAYAFDAQEEEDTHEPLIYQEAVAYEDISKWKVVMEEEINSLRKNKTWALVDHLAGAKAGEQQMVVQDKRRD